jgi:uncharacterized protein involved in response to NO
VSSRRITIQELGQEPFRLFFPLAVLAGIAAAAVWPLYFLEITQFYPGLIHARIMTFGFFGGFIFGFLGTALPRMLAVKPLRLGEALVLLVLHGAVIGAFLAARVELGDILFLIQVLLFAGCILSRATKRQDTPPPGFVLVGLAFVCAIFATGVSLVQVFREMDPFWVLLQRLAAYQGFVLLPILGVGGFILPRFFGFQSPHDFPVTTRPPREWHIRAGLAVGAGLLILISFWLEARGWFQFAPALRFLTAATYLAWELPVFRRTETRNALSGSLRLAFGLLLAGFLAVVLFPAHRVALLHLSLMGGFAVVALVVATRVVFGHSGKAALLSMRNRWLWVTVWLMVLGMATRISGDFWPHIMATHYSYGAVIWIGAILLWAFYVLPKVLLIEEE